jgi:hypothetical protein
MRNRREVAVPGQNERRSTSHGQPHRPQGAIDFRRQSLTPPKQSREETPQGDELLALSDQNNATDPELGARIEVTFSTICAVKLEAVLAAEIEHLPTTGFSPDEPRVPT